MEIRFKDRIKHVHKIRLQAVLAAAAAAIVMIFAGTKGISARAEENVAGAAGIPAGAAEISMDAGAALQTVMYGIGSTSKAVTAAAVMKLAEQGKIGLDTPLVSYIPEFEMDDDRYRLITPRMLLDHSSGLPGSTLTNAMLIGDPDTYNHDHLLEALKSQRLKADPGAYSTYCNDGFSLAEILVERVSGMSYTEFLNKEFAEPLGLDHFGSPQSGFPKESLAPVYDSETGWELAPEAANVIGSGGIYGTAEDICRFSRIFMENTEGSTQENGFRLGKDSLAQMKDSSYGRNLGISGHDTVLEYGLGWDSVNTYPFNRYGIQALSKGGDTVYYHASLTVLPEEGISCAVLSSGGSSTFNQIAVQEILLEYLDEIGRIEREEEKEEIRGEEAEPEALPDGFSDLAGWYDGREMFLVEMTEDGLILSGSGDRYARPQTYGYAGNGKFYSENGTYVGSGGSLLRSSSGRTGHTALEFRTAEDGRQYMMAQTVETYPGLGRTAVYLPLSEKLNTENGKTPDRTVLEAWEERDGKEFYLVSDKYTSAAYFDRFMVKMELLREPEGYLAFKDTALTIARLKTPTLAEFFQQVPGQAGRDLSDYEIRMDGGAEYLVTGSHRFLSEDGIEILPEKNAVITIGPDGDSIWFSSGSPHQNRQLMITVPENGSYFIYDHGSRDMTFAAGSYVGGTGQKVLLPKDGRIVFAGEAGARFELSYTDQP